MVIEHLLFREENTMKEGKKQEILDIFINWLLKSMD